jgi:hypothetical protein
VGGLGSFHIPKMGEPIEGHSSSNGKESSTASYTIVLTQSN